MKFTDKQKHIGLSFILGMMFFCLSAASFLAHLISFRQNISNIIFFPIGIIGGLFHASKIFKAIAGPEEVILQANNIENVNTPFHNRESSQGNNLY